MGMKWLELAVYTTDAGIEPVSAALTGVGITGLSIEESHASEFAFLKDRAPANRSLPGHGPICVHFKPAAIQTVSIRMTLVLPLSPLVLPPVMTTVSPFWRPSTSLAACSA